MNRLCVVGIVLISCVVCYFAPVVGEVLYNESFSQLPSQGVWAFEGQSGDGSRAWVHDGSYTILATAALTTYGHPGLTFSDFFARAQVQITDGCSAGTAGIEFRDGGAQNFYRAEVDGQGRARLVKSVAGQEEVIVDWLSSPAIHTCGSPNTLEVRAVGDQIAIYVNDERVVRTTDTFWASGDVGMFAWNCQASFKEFVIETPHLQTLTVSTAGSGSVSAMPAATAYVWGTTVVLPPQPASGWHFEGWSGAAPSSANPLSVVLDEDKAVTAAFAADCTIALDLLTTPCQPGDMVTITVKTAPGSRCSICVRFLSVVCLHETGLTPKVASQYGFVQWFWLLPADTTLGFWPITVTNETCGGQAVFVLEVASP